MSNFIITRDLRLNTRRLHAAGCKDVARELRTGHEKWASLENLSPETLLYAALDDFSDVCSDRFTPGTPEHTQACMDEFNVDLRILPCAKH